MEVCWRSILEMQDCLDVCGVSDIGFKGPSYTWKRGNLQERIDRACANKEWNTAWPNRFLGHLPFFNLDHKPILVSNYQTTRELNSVKQFKFLATWQTNPDFGNIVKKCWEKKEAWSEARIEFEVEASNWNHHVFREEMRQKHRLYARIQGIDMELESRYDRDLVRLQGDLWKDLEMILLREELSWFQRSRVSWLKFGDKNTKFFHSTTIARRRNNKVMTIKNKMGEWTADSNDLVNTVVGYFEKLFLVEEGAIEDYPIKGVFPRLEAVELNKLAIFLMRRRLRTLFLKWVDLKLQGWMVQDVNQTHLCLIPKKDNPESMKDFRPISLCSVSYKLVTKIIADRLRELMPKLVSPNQCAFIKGRNSADNILVAQEIINSMQRKKGDKRDDLDLPSNLVSVIDKCIGTSELNVLWNGKPTKFFKPSRGIRQGDPISPHLFVLCIERLGHLIQVANEVKAWKPILLRKNGPLISHLFFADDILLCMEASLEQAFVVNQVLRVFALSSGQNISLDKTRVFFSKNVGFNKSKEISECLGIRSTPNLGKYLGVYLNHSRVTKASFGHVMDRVKSRLSSWNAKSLSLAGRLTLVKSVMAAMPNYAMQTAWIPKSMCENIEKQARGFIWGSTENKRGVHLVNWETMCTRKLSGGAGLRNIKAFNQAFVMKVGFGLLTKKETLWARVLRNKYKVEEGLVPRIARSVGDSNIWRGLCSSWNQILAGSSIVMGDRRLINFWLDCWVLGIGRLIDKATAHVPVGAQTWRVANCVTQNGGWDWDKFNRYLSTEVCEVIADIEVPKVDDGTDKVIWRPSSNGLFSVRSAYQFIRDEAANLPNQDNLWDCAWKWQDPERIKHFLWLLLGNSLLTNEQRYRRHMGGEAHCPRCCHPCEDCKHVMWDCPWAKKVWMLLNPKFNVIHFSGSSFSDWLRSNLKIKKEKGLEQGWSLTFRATCWMLWQARNNLVFRNKVCSPESFCFKVRTYVNGIIQAEKTLGVIDNSPRKMEDCSVSWQPHLEGWIKINLDRACSLDGLRSGCGGVLRNSNGRWIVGFMKKVG
ncbi:uncharacterized protein LOC133310843 [Gastrolobium bilobum]|uniref:uncharacterized protein LOC133310843 n=1 Tax=Gastrolobium bilobum TaxID=150636 RepID=UPI002AAF50A2|nr:uncharacterized protein LOC133310843 [Gastrolobium bilobum]